MLSNLNCFLKSSIKSYSSLAFGNRQSELNWKNIEIVEPNTLSKNCIISAKPKYDYGRDYHSPWAKASLYGFIYGLNDKPPSTIDQGRTVYFSPNKKQQLEILQSVLLDLQKKLLEAGFSSSPKLYKVKGFRLIDKDGSMQFPSLTGRQVPTYHIGFNKDGRVIHQYSEPSPYGGLLLKNAIREIEVCHFLYSQKRALRPVGVFQFKDDKIRFQVQPNTKPQPLGFSVSQWPESEVKRADGLFNKASVQDYLSWAEALGIEVRNSSVWHYELLSKLYNDFGQALRAFHKGFYQYSADPNNFSFNRQSKKVFLVDFDTCRKRKVSQFNYTANHSSLDKPFQSKLQESLYLLRDIISVVDYLGIYLSRPNAEQSFDNLQLLKQSDPIAHMLEGYTGQSIAKGVYFNQLYDYFEGLRTKPTERQLTAAEIDSIAGNKTSMVRPWISRDLNYYRIIQSVLPFLNPDPNKYPQPKQFNLLPMYIGNIQIANVLTDLKQRYCASI
jgi:hypothetical protein